MTSTDRKAQARALAAEHGLKYTNALRALEGTHFISIELADVDERKEFVEDYATESTHPMSALGILADESMTANTPKGMLTMSRYLEMAQLDGRIVEFVYIDEAPCVIRSWPLVAAFGPDAEAFFDVVGRPAKRYDSPSSEYDEAFIANAIEDSTGWFQSEYSSAFDAACAALSARYGDGCYVGDSTLSDELTALLARHLLDESTPWNREAYDTLTRAYRTTVGSIHPDDTPMTEVAR